MFNLEVRSDFQIEFAFLLLRIEHLDTLTHLMSIWSHRDTNSSRQSEVRQFQISIFVNQQILWLQVAMENTMHVQEQRSIKELIHKFLIH